jgi:hypothetical protein
MAGAFLGVLADRQSKGFRLTEQLRVVLFVHLLSIWFKSENPKYTQPARFPPRRMNSRTCGLRRFMDSMRRRKRPKVNRSNTSPRYWEHVLSQQGLSLAQGKLNWFRPRKRTAVLRPGGGVTWTVGSRTGSPR